MSGQPIWQIVVLLVGVIAFGTVGYELIEGWSMFDALYMTVITVASVGFGETHPLSTAGRAFTIALITLGLGTVAYGLSTVTAFWVEGHISHLWEKRSMERRIARLHDHIVVCGGGETGRHIVQELVATRTPFVCIEADPGKEAVLQELGEEVVYVIGDATINETLRRVRVETARGLIATLPSDKDNLFVILTAREMHPTMRIVSRVVAEESRPKLHRAGADAVVSSISIGALRLASEMLRPHVVGFLDAMLRETGAIRVQEVAVGEAVAGRALGDLRIQERAGVIVFALREADARRNIVNPPPERVLAAGDVLIACADGDQLHALKTIATEG
ncbi:MAG: NAD-binding protein [Candidatus Rokubacteria bacterium]|nr:NAD-binding protein [Candidatus Rokubacteria bacterium]